MLLIPLPERLAADTMPALLAAAVSPDGAPLGHSLRFDLSPLRFIDACGMVVLTNLLQWLKWQGKQVGITGYDRYADGIKYLDDCGFFALHLGAPLISTAHPRDTTLPVVAVAHAQSHGWIELTAMPWLAQKLNMSTRSLADLSVSMKELFNNVLDHSTQEIASVHVQWHPKMKEIHVAISDFGIGIAKEVQRLRPTLTDPEALLLASQEGFSTKKGRNRGAGLAILIDNVAKRNRGYVGLYANRGILACNEDGCSPVLGAAYYPGTLVDIVLRTDTIEALPEEEELQW
jgi:anti-sigma regulatory factor (Ser/Thr protein kinase)